MFDFGRANEAQREAIQTVNGPVLITAGPGTGKTFTLVQRVLYMIEQAQIPPEQILIATYTAKAAKELITRISDALLERNIPVNLRDMRIGTIHSICMGLLEDYAEYTVIPKSFRLMDEFEQKYTVMLNSRCFKNLEGYQLLVSGKTPMERAGKLCSIVNGLREEMVDPEALIRDRDPRVCAAGRLLKAYGQLLREKNLLDYADLQMEVLRMLRQNPRLLKMLREKIRYLMVDEYQDTNFVQEQIVFLLAGENENLCVVGDDDQSIYRFRGATVRNILEFCDKFPKGRCCQIDLSANYRSDPQIVDFYSRWMENPGSFQWGRYRRPKQLTAQGREHAGSPAVIRLDSGEGIQTWCENILKFIRGLQDSGTLEDLNQIAFLFSSVSAKKDPDVAALAAFLERNGIRVFSPRSEEFFCREEIKMVVGAVIMMFPDYFMKLTERSFSYNEPELYAYYDDCVRCLKDRAKAMCYQPLRSFIIDRFRQHKDLKQNTDYGVAELVYQLFAMEPFAGMLEPDMHAGVLAQRQARNLAKFTALMSQFEQLHGFTQISPEKIHVIAEKLFNTYLRCQREVGVGEYEGDEPYAPSGSVAFLTVHQSKGMEFPVVITDLPSRGPFVHYRSYMDHIEAHYYHRPPFEPVDQVNSFDFWRKYYTAFSRSQSLLVLTAREYAGAPCTQMEQMYRQLSGWNSPEFDPSAFSLPKVKSAQLKTTYSFTSHIAVYEDCPRYYLFSRELGFAPAKGSNAIFGQIVHQTIEDVNKAAIGGQSHIIDREHISGWLEANYRALAETEKTYLPHFQRQKALEHVLRYVKRQSEQGGWEKLREAEMVVSLLKPTYIIEGTVDLIRGVGDTVELVDFKSDRTPDFDRSGKRLTHYRQQLELYAYLVEQKTGLSVTGLHLYYTAVERGNPQVSFLVDRTHIHQTIENFDRIVQRIEAKDFSAGAGAPGRCRYCDFRHYCGKKQSQ